MYKYSAKITRVVDGDTVDAYIDLGFKIGINVRLRLEGINAPESRTRDLEEKKAGLVAKEWLREAIEGQSVIVDTEKTGKFGRYIAIIYTHEGLAQESPYSVNEKMLDLGLAVVYGEKWTTNQE